VDEFKGRSCLHLKNRSWLLLEKSECVPSAESMFSYWFFKSALLDYLKKKYKPKKRT